MRNRIVWLLAATSVAVLATSALAHEGDVEIEVNGGALYVPPAEHEQGELLLVFGGELGEFPFPANQGNDPGFEAEGGFADGDVVGFNLVTDLIYWNGGESLSPVPTDHSVTVEKSVYSLTADGTSGYQTGFGFATADAGGTFHEHLTYTLNGPGAEDEKTPGIYGLWLELTSSGYETSNDFIVLLNYGLEEETFEEGVHFIGEHVIPEPSSAALLVIGGLLLYRRRR